MPLSPDHQRAAHKRLLDFRQSLEGSPPTKLPPKEPPQLIPHYYWKAAVETWIEVNFHKYLRVKSLREPTKVEFNKKSPL